MKKSLILLLFIVNFAFGQSTTILPSNTTTDGISNSIVGNTTGGIGVLGTATTGYGVYASSTSSYGIFASSTNSHGVWGISINGNGANGTSSNGNGVVGNSSSSAGIFGTTATGFGGYFNSTGAGKALVTLNGNVGIGTINPNLNSTEIMDINKRVRIRHSTMSAGIWFNNSSNTISDNDGAFFGINNSTAGSESAGIYIGNNWRFNIDRSGNTTIAGGLSVGGGENISKISKITRNAAITVGANSSSSFTFGHLGVTVGDVVVCNIEADLASSGLIVANVYVFAANNIRVTISNPTTSSQSIPASNFHFIVYK
jgi:hypothetical protein